MVACMNLATRHDPEIRAVPGWDGYFVSVDGRVFSSKRNGWRELKLPLCNTGYPHVSLCRAGEVKSFQLHTIVAATFLNKPKRSDVVRHLDGNPKNNAVENLAYGTYADNEADKERHGRRLKGAAVYGSKLSDADVMAIRNAFLNGSTLPALSKRYGLNQTSMHAAIHGGTWKHIPVPDYSARRLIGWGKWNVGSRHGMAKLTEETAAQAIEMLACGESTAEIGKALGVSRQAVSHIAAGRTWKHLPRPYDFTPGVKRSCTVTGRPAEPWWPI